MVSLISTLSSGARTEPPPEPCKPLSETWSGERLLPTSRCVALDVDDEPGADVKVIVKLEARDGFVRGRVVDVKPVDEARGDVPRFLPQHRAEAIRRGLEQV